LARTRGSERRVRIWRRKKLRKVRLIGDPLVYDILHVRPKHPGVKAHQGVTQPSEDTAGLSMQPSILGCLCPLRYLIARHHLRRERILP
jgi:hypothetical protein